jgi:preprotein translocase subunit SecG
MGLGILATWVFNNTAGSVVLIMMLHVSFNTSAGFFGEMFAGADLIRMSWLLAAGWCVEAIAVVAVAGPVHLSRDHHKQEEREETAEPGRATPGAVKLTPEGASTQP